MQTHVVPWIVALVAQVAAIPMHALVFAVYGSTKRRLEEGNPSNADAFVAGAVSGASAAFIASPAEMAKCRLQVCVCVCVCVCICMFLCVYRRLGG